jgi:hypothetical protein
LMSRTHNHDREAVDDAMTARAVNTPRIDG